MPHIITTPDGKSVAVTSLTIEIKEVSWPNLAAICGWPQDSEVDLIDAYNAGEW